MAHNAACAASKTPPWECDCSCRGTLHGQTPGGAAIPGADYSIPPQEPLVTEEWIGGLPGAFRRARGLLLPYAQTAHHHAVEHYDGWREALTWPEERAMVDYRGEGYGPVNAANRGVIRTTRRIRRQTEAIDRAIRSAPPTERELIAYRNVGSPEVVALWESGGIQPGHTFPERAFASTSLDPAVAMFHQKKAEGGILCQIFLRKGTRAAYLDVVHNMRERELLLPRSQWFRYVEASNIGGIRVAILEVIDGPPPETKDRQ